MPRFQKPSGAEPAPVAKKAVATKDAVATKKAVAGKPPVTTKQASGSKQAAAKSGAAATRHPTAKSAAAEGKKPRATVGKTDTAPPRATKKKPAAASAPLRPGSRRASGAGVAEDELPREEFLTGQRSLLLDERTSYTRHAEELKAEADSLALEHEPGDVQFDEEGGEGGTSNIDRELDLVLSAQARAAINEIDRALAKIGSGTYGVCEQCGQRIPQARLKALPYAALCVACKSGGLSRRA